MSALTELLDAQADTVEVSTAVAPAAIAVPEMSGLRKAAIVLMNMDRAASAEVLRHLGEERSEICLLYTSPSPRDS